MDSTLLGHLCSRCGAPASGSAPHTVSSCCQAPLRSTYDLARAATLLAAPGASGRPGLWRYAAVLPVTATTSRISLGEGGSPLLPAPGLEREHGGTVHVKDESGNPTGSFKDRGLAVAVSLAHQAGTRALVLPTAGNAGAAAAAYGARAGMSVSIHAPETTPGEILSEIRLRGAKLQLHPGSIADAGRHAAAEAQATGALSVATFREPGRVEGKKTMAYELFEQLGRIPDAIVYPCGGGTGIVAMAQAFDEMEGLGWIGSERPRLWAVQSAGCAPIVRAFECGAETAEAWEDPRTFAAGLRVPGAFADRMILDALRRTDGGAIAVDEREIVDAGLRLAGSDGILACPEGAAAVAGYARLRHDGHLADNDLVVIFQTGSVLKYLGAWETALRENAAPR